jgi:hypothetical protein
MDETCDMHGRDQKCIKILAGKSEGKKHLGIFIRTSEDNIERIYKSGGRLCTSFIWFRTGRSGGLLRNTALNI